MNSTNKSILISYKLLKNRIIMMNATTWLMIGMTTILVLTIVVAVIHHRDLRRLEEQDRVIKSLRKQLDHLLGTRYMDPGKLR